MSPCRWSTAGPGVRSRRRPRAVCRCFPPRANRDAFARLDGTPILNNVQYTLNIVRLCGTVVLVESTTAWGDAEGRRRDILDSAEKLLAESGYAGLTMRAIAVGAGVSSGTLYQYFDGKEDVFVALMAGRLEALRTTLDGLDRGIGIAGLLREILPQVRELWRLFGRSAQQWESKVLAGGRRGKRAVTSATVFRRTIRSLDRALRETAASAGQRLVD